MRRPYQQIYDQIGNVPISGGQLDSPLTEEFVTIEAKNVRTLIDAQNRTYDVGDTAVSPKGTKHIVWSSEGFTYRGLAIPALTATQKKASGTIATNFGAAPSHPSKLVIPSVLDFSLFRYLQLVVVFTSFTSGSTPSIQFELDFLDDTSTPNKFVVWNPAALTSAGSFLVDVGPGLSVPPASAPTGYANTTVPTGWTVYNIPYVVSPNGTFSWTVTGTPTAAVWTAWLYGQY
jgi:hypothetical protein